MLEKPCTIYDCEFDSYQKGVIKDNIVYAISNQRTMPAKEIICEYVDYGLVQFYIGEYNSHEELDYGFKKKNTKSKWGFFDHSTGEIVITPQYEYAYPFYGDRAKVELNGKFGFIDPDGNIAVNIVWDECDSSFTRGNVCQVKKDQLWGLVDKNGNIIVHPQYEVIKDFEVTISRNEDSDYAALIIKDGKYGFINTKGNYLIEPYLDQARSFWGRLYFDGDLSYAPVMIRDKWGYIDSNGEFVVALQFDDVGGMDSISIKDEKALFGRKSISFQTVKKDNQWGIIDQYLNIIIPNKGVRYVEYEGHRIYIKDGRITSSREIK